jgi:hypothetical protein
VVFLNRGCTLVAMVVVMMGLVLFQFNSNPSFEEYNQHENAYFTERSEVNVTLKQQGDLLNAKEYATAIPIFEALLNKTPEIQYFMYMNSIVRKQQYKKESEDV